ncbi:epimerase [Ruegeria sp. 2205SS24-7]|uniref:epimerase n=1 Tax=Ruegeria discodermiae TaxID=3064389 RepID=UPI0027403A30|nr:epimerase [Ruegeria sp. 2205SS24-7]MDP5215958.1 epimerase [Ruegeria sp. 2205SS24-7]
MGGTVLILGASGRFGSAAADAFWKAGWFVRFFNREADDLGSAASGADVIVNGWNPPYDQWAATVPELTRQVIAAARTSGAMVIVPGNVYVFGVDSPARFDADTPHHATNPLGRIRIEMEDAYRKSGVKTLILRAGDFIDTARSDSWLDKVILAKLDRGRFTYPGDADQPHAWAFLPDMARATVALAEKRDQLARFEDVPFPGHTLTGRELAEAVASAFGRPLGLHRFNWLPVRMMSPFWKMGRHLVEMRYLWSKPHALDGTRLSELLPEFEATPVQEALTLALSAAQYSQTDLARVANAKAREKKTPQTLSAARPEF